MAQCANCDLTLVGRQKRWCSVQCQREKFREEWLNQVYGITIEEYETILDYQNRVCAICRRPPKPGKSLAVDHAHHQGSSGPIRGLLCFVCNRRLVGAKSDAMLSAMGEYVRNYPATAALGREVIAPGRPKKKRQPRKRMR